MGFYLIDKDKGRNSFSIINQIKTKDSNIIKAGHSGTLDPFTTGLMIIATNEHTKLLDFFLFETKTYIGEILFGKRTDTLDIDGITIEEDYNVNVSLEDLKKVISEKFNGKISQVPPKFSAKKINGEKAYVLARNQKEFTLKPEERHIYSFDIEPTKNKNIFKFKIKVSSGTYIRAVARDIGDYLKVPSMLISLRRTHIGFVSVDFADKINSNKFHIYSVKEALNIDTFEVSQKKMKTILEGKVFGLRSGINNKLLILKFDDIEVLVKKIDDEKRKFKIFKRLK